MMTADDVLPLVANLPPLERMRLLRWMTSQANPNEAAAVYRAVPPGTDEFASDEEPLAWEAEGWESCD